MSPYVRTVRTASGARAVQVVHSSWKGGGRGIEHIGSAHGDAEPAVLKEVAGQRLNAGRLSLDLPGLNSENDAGSAPQAPAGAGCVAPIASNRVGVLLEALEAAWKAVGLDGLDGADEVFRQLVTAGLIEPTSKQDSLRLLAEAGLSPVSYATVERHLPATPLRASPGACRACWPGTPASAGPHRSCSTRMTLYYRDRQGRRPCASRASPRKDAWSRGSR